MRKKREEFDVNNKIILNFWDISNAIRRLMMLMENGRSDIG